MTSIPETIPGDILSNAKATYDQMCDTLGPVQIYLKIIAAALLAERRAQIERDAEIAASASYHVLTVRRDIAAAIRSQLTRERRDDDDLPFCG